MRHHIIIVTISFSVVVFEIRRCWVLCSQVSPDSTSPKLSLFLCSSATKQRHSLRYIQTNFAGFLLEEPSLRYSWKIWQACLRSPPHWVLWHEHKAISIDAWPFGIIRDRTPPRYLQNFWAFLGQLQVLACNQIGNFIVFPFRWWSPEAVYCNFQERRKQGLCWRGNSGDRRHPLWTFQGDCSKTPAAHSCSLFTPPSKRYKWQNPENSSESKPPGSSAACHSFRQLQGPALSMLPFRQSAPLPCPRSNQQYHHPDCESSRVFPGILPWGCRSAWARRCSWSELAQFSQFISWGMPGFGRRKWYRRHFFRLGPSCWPFAHNHLLFLAATSEWWGRPKKCPSLELQHWWRWNTWWRLALNPWKSTPCCIGGCRRGARFSPVGVEESYSGHLPLSLSRKR